jgi:hypothetical protein
LSRVLFYAFGGGYGHLNRTRHLLEEVKRRAGVTTLVLCPTRAQPWVEAFSPCSACADIGRAALGRWVDEQMEGFRPDLVVVDTFPRGILGELNLPQKLPKVLVTRWVIPDYYRMPGVFQALVGYSEICWTEPRSDVSFPGTDCQPVLSAAEPRPREQARALLRPRGPLVLALGSGKPAEQLAWAKRLQACAKARSWDLRWYSRELGTARENLGRDLRAADAVISAAGYNSYYEIASVGVPVLWLPQKRLTDDQFRRAQGEFPFSHQGAQRVATGPEDLRSSLDTLLQSSAVAGQRPQGRAQVVDILLKHLQKGAWR